MSVEVLAILPLRLASSRIPKKVLQKISAHPLGTSTALKARAALESFGPRVRVLAAVDDEKVAASLRTTGVEVIMTPSELPSGTDRVLAAAQIWLGRQDVQTRSKLKGILNVQGDMPFVGAEGLRQAVRFFLESSGEALKAAPMITLAQAWPAEQKYQEPAAVKVLTNQQGFALYFSRYPIPYGREKLKKGATPLGRLHIGVYGYTPEALARICAQAPIELERAEGLEQLRAQWLGIPILVLDVDPDKNESYRGVDTPADLRWARNFARPKKKKRK